VKEGTGWKNGKEEGREREHKSLAWSSRDLGSTASYSLIRNAQNKQPMS